MRRRSPIALLVALALVIVPAVTAPVAAGGGHSERDRILAFWTSERLQSATPREYVKSGGGFVPAARPPSGGGGGSVTGASWTKAGAILKASGKVYFVMGSSAYVCSGSVGTHHPPRG